MPAQPAYNVFYSRSYCSFMVWVAEAARAVKLLLVAMVGLVAKQLWLLSCNACDKFFLYNACIFRGAFLPAQKMAC